MPPLGPGSQLGRPTGAGKVGRGQIAAPPGIEQEQPLLGRQWRRRLRRA
jgi:hypothetical protein